MLNRIGLDAMVYGNHEFDLGPEPLAKFIETAEFPVISGSADVSADNLLAPLAARPPGAGDRRREGGDPRRRHARTPPRSPRPARPSASAPRSTTCAARWPRCRPRAWTRSSCSATSAPSATRRWRRRCPGIDLIVGGHSHTLFSNTAEDAPFKYPLMVDGPDGHAVPIVQAGAYSKYLGHVTLTFDDAGVVTEATGDTRLLDASVTPDPDTLARIKELAGPIEELKARVVAEIPAGIDGSRETCRAQECADGRPRRRRDARPRQGPGRHHRACRTAAACAPRSAAAP